MNYLISHYGNGIAVGLIKEEGAEEEMNLAHNLFNIEANTGIFHGTINFKSLGHFRRFLVDKWFLRMYSESNKPTEVKKFYRKAVEKAKQVLENNVEYQNFMFQISASNNFYNYDTFSIKNDDEDDQ